jgi:hypothetical protein
MRTAKSLLRHDLIPSSIQRRSKGRRQSSQPGQAKADMLLEMEGVREKEQAEAASKSDVIPGCPEPVLGLRVGGGNDRDLLLTRGGQITTQTRRCCHRSCMMKGSHFLFVLRAPLRRVVNGALVTVTPTYSSLGDAALSTSHVCWPRLLQRHCVSQDS